MAEAIINKMENPVGSLRRVILALVALLGLFALPLYKWASFSLHDELYGHAVLVPLISLYLIWTNRENVPLRGEPAPALGAALFGVGGLFLAMYWARSAGGALGREEAVTWTMLAFFSCLAGVLAGVLGKKFLRGNLFALGFLLCAVPLPIFVRAWIEGRLQYGSAAMAYAMFRTCGTLAEWKNLDIDLSTITLTIAPECSGIHSSLVLLVTALLAGHLFLRSPVHRLVLALVIIPLAVVRNGFRIFTIGELCVHIGPHMIDHWIHHRGGPVFFSLALVPFLLLLYVLVRREQRRQPLEKE